MSTTQETPPAALAAPPPSRTHPARRRFTTVVAALLGLGLVLTACSHTPTSYTDSVKKDFVNGCSNPNTAPHGTPVAAKPECVCVYDKTSAKDGIPFKDFKKLEDDLQQNPKPLDQAGTTGQQMAKFYSECQNGGSPTGSTSGGSSSTTAPTAHS